VILGIGIDIIEIDRVEEAIKHGGEEFVRRTFVDREVNYCEKETKKYQYYAARIAAKEAAFKAIGTGWQRGAKWTDIEIKNDELGKPVMHLKGEVKHMADKLGVESVMVTLSHCETYAIAQVVLEGYKRYGK